MIANTETIFCKVVILGELEVGKTSIINRYTQNTFQETTLTTVGASFASKTIIFEEYLKTIKFEIWDTAGQEKYRSLTKIFYKDASVAILVYDICRKQSFEDIKNFWYGQLKEQAPKKLSKIFVLIKISFKLSQSLQINLIYMSKKKLRRIKQELLPKK